MNAFNQQQPPPKPHLYVGNLHPNVNERILMEIFAVAGRVQLVKIIADRNLVHGGLSYGFVEYMDMHSAETAIATLNGRRINDLEIKVNWANQGNSAENREDLSDHFHVFVGDLSSEVNDLILAKAFSAFKSISDARVMWDLATGKSRSFGFLSFKKQEDADAAIASMNGEVLGSRPIQVRWAQNSRGPSTGGSNIAALLGGASSAQNQPPFQVRQPLAPNPAVQNNRIVPPSLLGGVFDPKNALPYETVLMQTPNYNTTVYCGNLDIHTVESGIRPLFEPYGIIADIKIHSDRGFAFVKMSSHESAAMSIVRLHGTSIHGRLMKTSWGKEKDPAAPPNSVLPPPPATYHHPSHGTMQPSNQTYNPYHPDFSQQLATFDPALTQAQYNAYYTAYYDAQIQLQNQFGQNSLPIQQ